MKRLIFMLVTVLAASLAARASVTINSTNFPDANFRAYLLSEYPSGTITTAQLNARTELVVESKNIYDAKGVEYFTQLTRLSFFSNNLSSIDVSANTKLTYLNLGRNKLTSINVNSNTALEQLYLQYNQLTSVYVINHSSLRTLWVNNNTNLTEFICYGNNLTNVDVTSCTNLQTLKCYYNANLATINNLATCTALEYLDCEDCAITDLSAVQSFSQLETLLARNNQLTTLTITGKSNLKTVRLYGNTRLTKLTCTECYLLTDLNIGQCTALTELHCYNNYKLPEITNLRTCTALKILDCYSCSLTDLSVINYLSDLEQLICSDNKLTSFNINNKTKLTRVLLDDNESLSRVDIYGNHALQTINVSGCTGLDTLNCYTNSSLSQLVGLADCTYLSQADLRSNAFTSIAGLQGKARLVKINCQRNNLTSLNFQGCTSLVRVECDLNQISGSGMSTLVNSLRTCSASNRGMLIVRSDVNSYEANVITDAQAVTAYNKNWDVYTTVPGGYDLIVSLDKALNAEGGNIHFTTSGDYPWVLDVDENGYLYAKSSNSGVASSVSTLTATVNVPSDNLDLETIFKARGEGTSTIYDKCQFFIDGVQIYCHGELFDSWSIHRVPITRGTHTLTWSYSKDSSVNPSGDYFAIEEVSLKIALMRGDVDGSGNVSIDDVTALIDHLLGGNYDINYTNADADQNGNITIDDVTALIDYLLTGHWN